VSIVRRQESTITVHKSTGRKKSIGLCLNCGHRVTLCGMPFSAEITCNKCLFINVFQDSQQPVACRPMLPDVQK
jgi:hypothetical protein